MSAPDRRGLLSALGAFCIWGLSPLFFKALASLGAFEVVAHRVLWSVVLLLPLIGLTQGFGQIRRAFGDARLAALLVVTMLLAGSNWLIYVWAIMAGRTVEASLGYFINPLVNVALGAIFLHERLRPLQKLAVGLAALGVATRIWAIGHLPWVALALAVTFAVYGLLRKRAPVDSLNGLCVETLVALPIALAYLGWELSRGELRALHGGAWMFLLLPAAGLITTIPLWLFTEGARRLPLSVLGLVQYLAPTLQFLIAVWVFHEPFGTSQLMSFGLIWTALAVFSWDLLRSTRSASNTQ